MKVLIALCVVVCVAVAKPPRRACSGKGNPKGYGACASEEPYCDPGFECQNGVCCRSNDFNKPRVCPIGKPWGYRHCDDNGNCPGDLKCIEEVCCKTPKERVCPAGKPGGFGFCDEDDSCADPNHYCHDTEEGEKVCCEDGDSSSEEEEEPVCQFGNPLGFGECDSNLQCLNTEHECQTTPSGETVCCEKAEPVCQFGNPLGFGECDSNLQCLNPEHECQTTPSGETVCCEKAVFERQRRSRPFRT